MIDKRKRTRKIISIKEATIDEVMTWYTGDERWNRKSTFESVLCNSSVDNNDAEYEDIKHLWNNRQDKIEVVSKRTFFAFDVEFKYKSKLYSYGAINAYPNTNG